MTDSNLNPTPSYSAGPPADAKKTKSIVSLVLGLVSLLGGFIPLLGGAGIAAVIVGMLARRSEPAGQKLALWGIIAGIVGFVLGVIAFIVGLIAVQSLLQNGGVPAS
ncbi:MAG: hypothetical protein RI885_2477 [Actinomycetota bacterium]